MELNRVHIGDCRKLLRQMAAAGVKAQTCVTSPPYFGLRDYKVRGQIGLEASVWKWLDKMVEVFELVREVLTDDGTLWLNLGDSYASNGGAGWQGKTGQRADRRFTAQRDSVGLRRATRRAPIGIKPKDLMGQPWRVAFALQEAGWYLRQDIVWSKPNPMPESVKDRFCKSHEYVFLLSKSERYYFDQDAVKEPASLDTHARYARGRSDSHKYADGGPGGQTIAKTFEHMRKPVGGWDMGLGRHSTIEHATSPKYPEQGEEHRTKAGLADSERKFRPRKLAAPGSGTKANTDFDSAMRDMPDKRNKRSVWTISPEPFSGAHFATLPRALVEPCILAGSRPVDIVLDPFLGSGTVAQVAYALGRQWVGFELQRAYLPLIEQRLQQRNLSL